MIPSAWNYSAPSGVEHNKTVKNFRSGVGQESKRVEREREIERWRGKRAGERQEQGEREREPGR